jgi:hypothetical protein
VLSDSITNLYSEVPYCISAFLPLGSNIKVVIRSSPGFSLRNTNGWNSITSTWDSSPGSPEFSDDSLVFKSYGREKIVYREIISHAPTKLIIDIFENNDVAPTRTRNVIVN